MFEAFFWGAVGASALLVGALLAYVTKPSPKLIAVMMALGAGLLIGSISFELIDEALKQAEVALVGLFTLIGAATFTAGNWFLDRKGAGDRKDSEGAQASGSPLAIVFGSVLDGVPESFVLGLTVLQGGVSVALLIGVVLSNLPEGLSSSSGLRIAGWPRARVVKMWLIVIAVSAVSAALGYAAARSGQRTYRRFRPGLRRRRAARHDHRHHAARVVRRREDLHRRLGLDRLLHLADALRALSERRRNPIMNISTRRLRNG